MKKITLAVLITISAIITFAQAPQAFKYQAIVRDNNGELVANQNVSCRISILQGSTIGTAVYVETHDTITSEFGLVNLEISNGTVESGDFGTIDWGEESYFLQVELDETGGQKYQHMGTSQLMAVPYSFHSKKSESIIVVDSVAQIDSISNPLRGMMVCSINETKNDGNPEVFIYDGSNWVPFIIGQGTNEGDILYWDGTQWIAVPVGLDGDVLTLSDGLPGWGSPVRKPSVSTYTITGITPYEANSGGCVNDGGSVVIAKGICWNTSPNPTISDSKTNDGQGSECFSSNLTALETNTTYYVSAYATNALGTGYGNEEVFSTDPAVPIIVTYIYVQNVTPYSARGRGSIINDWGFPISTSGLCWSTSPNPDTSDFKTTDGSATGTFYSYMIGLLPNTLYYFRAFATNVAGTGYGDDVEFTTLPSTPYLGTSTASDITAHSAEGGGYINDDWGFSITAKGVCWSTSPNPDTSDLKTLDGSGSGSYNSYLTNLTANTLYYHRAYAISSEGVGYGPEKSFTTQDGIASLNTPMVFSITAFSATSGGTSINDGGSPITSKGVCWSISQNPTLADSLTVDGSGTDNYYSYLTGLTPATYYYVRAYVINTVDTFYGDEESFSTLDGTIILTTTPVTDTMGTHATSGGDITDDGGSDVTTRGVCWSTLPNPTTADSFTVDGDGTGSFVSDVSSLTINTMYYIKAYATNAFGTFYGNEISFTSASTYYLGEEYGGGRIFYLDGSGTHGLIAATIDQADDVPWGCEGTLIGTSTDIGTGAANTTAIVAGCSTQGIAAHICDTLTLNGYTDWFLPSFDELQEMYVQRSLIGMYYSNGQHWSSSEFNNSQASTINFHSGSASYNYKNSTPGTRVRAIREF